MHPWLPLRSAMTPPDTRAFPAIGVGAEQVQPPSVILVDGKNMEMRRIESGVDVKVREESACKAAVHGSFTIRVSYTPCGYVFIHTLGNWNRFRRASCCTVFFVIQCKKLSYRGAVPPALVPHLLWMNAHSEKRKTPT